MLTKFFRAVVVVFSAGVLTLLVAKAQGCGEEQAVSNEPEPAAEAQTQTETETQTQTESETETETGPELGPLTEVEAEAEAEEPEQANMSGRTPRVPESPASNNSGGMNRYRIEGPASKSGAVFYPEPEGSPRE